MEKEFLMNINMRKITTNVKSDRFNSEKEWNRLGDIKYVSIWNKPVGYYIEVSRKGTGTRAVILGDPSSEVYNNTQGEGVRDFELVSSTLSAFRAEIESGLGRTGAFIEFL